MTSALRQRLQTLFGDTFLEMFQLLNDGVTNGSPVVHGAWDKPIAIDPGIMFVPYEKERNQLFFVRSTGGEQITTSDPQIKPGSFIGQRIIFIGTSDTDIITFDDLRGMQLNGSKPLRNGNALIVFYDGRVWREEGRG